MGWAREYPSFDADLGGRKAKLPGYTYKLCPYSSAYRERFKYEGQLCTGFDAYNVPIYSTGTFVCGNSTDQAFYGLDYVSYPCSEHVTTSGQMLPSSNPPGWVCPDPNCYYTITVESGSPYREV
jgi:hypothetical protein